MVYVTSIQVALVLQIISKTSAQFPMSYPFPGHPMMAPGMAPGPPPMPVPPPPMMPPPMMQAPMPGPLATHYPLQQKLPVVVMPYYSKSSSKSKGHKKNKKRPRRTKKEHHDSTCESDSSETSSSGENNYRRAGEKKRRQVLTPMVSYVTKDGYVVYQKKIKKDKAVNWLTMAKGKEREAEEMSDDEVDYEPQKRKKHRKHWHHTKH